MIIQWHAEEVPNPITHEIDTLVLDDHNDPVCIIFNRDGEKGMANAFRTAQHIATAHNAVALLGKLVDEYGAKITVK